MQVNERLGGLDVVRVGPERARDAVVLLHGFGAPGDDLVGLYEYFAAEDRALYFPAALLELGRDFGGDSRAWWPIDMVKLQMALATGAERSLRAEDPAGLPAAKARVVQLLSEIRERAVERVVLGGFSQGAMLATDIALTTSVQLEGLLLFSGTLLREDVWRTATPAAPLKFFASHGRMDPILPFGGALALTELLKSKGFQGELLAFSGAHQIPMPALAGARALLDAVFQGPV